MKAIYEHWRKLKLNEGQTAKIENLPAAEISNLIDLLLGKESALEVTEKLAGRHIKVTITADGEIFGFTKGKQQPFKLPKTIADPLEPLVDGSERNFSFEILQPQNRPDYVHYLIDKIVYADVSGELSDEEAKLLSNDDIIFLTKRQLMRDEFNLTPEQEQELKDIQQRLQQKVKSAEKKEISQKIASIILAPNVKSFFGGAMEGFFVTGASKDFKIPSPSYADIQRIQSPLYAVWTGRAGMTKAVVKKRFLYGGYKDKIVKDVVKYLYSVMRGYPSGYKSFFSPDEAEYILDMLNNPKNRRTAYKVINGRINDRSNWHIF